MAVSRKAAVVHLPIDWRVMCWKDRRQLRKVAGACVYRCDVEQVADWFNVGGDRVEVAQLLYT